VVVVDGEAVDLIVNWRRKCCSGHPAGIDAIAVVEDL